jgi:putative modified peptide
MISDSKSQPMDPAVVDKLLDGLSNDDDFRTLFTKDPRAALEKVGYKADSNAALRCAQVTTLASKDEIATARKALYSYLTDRNAAAMTIIFNFEAGKIESSLPKS